MNKKALLVPLLALLAGCVTQPQVTVRRGKIIKLDQPAPAPAPLAVAPRPAPATIPVAHAAPITPAAPTPVAPPSPPVLVTSPVIVPAPARPETSTPEATIAPVAAADSAAPLSARRDGSVVQVSWTLPASDVGYKAIEIMRNDRDQAQGRSRVRAVRATVTTIEDTLPDSASEYWYWLKLTRQDGQVQNIGPVAASKG